MSSTPRKPAPPSKTGKAAKEDDETAEEPTATTTYMRILERGIVPLNVALPLAYLKILEKEAKLLGWKRGQFLEHLLRRKYGQLMFERPASAPSYTVASDRELAETKKWIWYLKEDFRTLLDKDRLRMGIGNVAVSAWIVTMLNQWLGTPNGLPLEGT